MSEKVKYSAESTIAANRYLFERRMETNRKLMKWGFGGTALGIGLILTGAALAPIIPLAAAYTMVALGSVATWGFPVGIFGAIKNAVDKRRKR